MKSAPAERTSSQAAMIATVATTPITTATKVRANTVPTNKVAMIFTPYVVTCFLPSSVEYNMGTGVNNFYKKSW